MALDRQRPLLTRSDFGLSVVRGEGKPENQAEAVEWFLNAAEQGHVVAHVRLDFMHANGRGVQKSRAEAQKWFHKAAELGDAWAQTQAGHDYNFGRYVRENDIEAVKWYRKAADQGFAEGQSHLGWMYETGQGVPEDYVQAYAWLNLAAAQGYESAIQGKDELRERMTDKQIAQAQELSTALFLQIGTKGNTQSD